MSEPTTTDTGGSVWDAPNQQVVRDDASAPWDEGDGGDTEQPVAKARTNVSLDEMTKDELLEHAQSLGVSPANAGMTKDELRAGVDAKQAEGA